MIVRSIELVFVFFSKIYIFFYKEKNDYWKMFPTIIMSGILMINILFRKKDYTWAVQYSISRKQRIIISLILIVDFILVGILFTVARNNHLAMQVVN